MIDKLQTIFEQNDNFAKLLGFEIVEIKEGYAKVKMQIKDTHLNAAGTLHGGCLFSLADYAFAIASNSKNNLSFAICANILFHKAISKGVIYATANEIQDGKNIASYQVKINTKDGTLLATFSGNVFRKGVEIIPTQEQYQSTL